MRSAGVRYVIAKLIFLLVALNRKRCDGRSELIVPKCFAAGGGQKISGEGKIERFADGGIPRLGMMEAARRER